MAGSVHGCRARRLLSFGCLAAVLALAAGACQFPPLMEGAVPGAETKAAGIRVRSSPSGAHIAIGGSEAAERTPALLSPVPPGEHEVTISLPGYTPWRKRVLIEAGETVNLDVLLQPAATGSLSVSSVPFQSTIFIDGRPTPWLTPATIENLSLGTHTILLRRDGYEDWSQAIVIVENRRLQLKASLRPARALRGNLNIQTSPSRAEIFLDGYPTGNFSPTTLFSLVAGSHTIQFRKKGFATWSDEVTVMQGTTSNLLVTLKPAERELSGSAEIDSIPPGAEVTLDGVRLREKTPVLLESVATGLHSLKVEKYGFLAWEGSVSILPGERTVHSVTLDYRISGMLDLLVTSTPAGAAVWLDGQPSGQVTPATFDDLTPGRHQVSVEKEGYRVWSRAVQVSSNRVAVVEADLLRADARLEASVLGSDEERIELEARLLQEGGEPAGDDSITFALDPPYFGWLAPKEAPLHNGRARTELNILSPLQKVRLTLSSGRLRAGFIVEKGVAGWKIIPAQDR